VILKEPLDWGGGGEKDVCTEGRRTGDDASGLPGTGNGLSSNVPNDVRDWIGREKFRTGPGGLADIGLVSCAGG
jgi:hypothetical protein